MDEKLKKYFGDKIKEQDVKEYNYDVFSSLLDSVAYLLSKHRIVSFENGTIISFLADQTTLLSNFDNTLSLDYQDSLSKKDYKLFPFSIAHNMELRAKYLLQTDSTDNFNDLLEEFFTLIEPIFFEADIRIPLLKEAIKKSEERLFNSKFKFLSPIKGHEQNDLEELKNPEEHGVINMASYDEDGVIEKGHKNIFFEERTDNHDLLALKELVLILRKEKKMDRFSIAMGFFNKYMPELNDLGIKHVTITVNNKGELASLQMYPYKKTEIPKQVHYSPNKASSVLGALNRLKRYPDNKDELGKNELVFVSTLGDVATSDKLTLSGHLENVTDKTSLCAETYVFELHNSEVMGTRTFFTPMSYEDFPMLLRNGSVIFGMHDYTFHSAVRVDKDRYFYMRNHFLDRYNNDYEFSPAWVCARHRFQSTGKDQKTKDDWIFFYRPENEDYLMGIINSVYEKNPFTDELYSTYETLPYMKNIKPLHKRMSLDKYVNHNEFDYEGVESWWERIAIDFKGKFSLEVLKRKGMRDETMRLIKEEGLSLEDAMAKVLGNPKDENEGN